MSRPIIYLNREFVDFRKSINGLAALIESETDLPLDSGELFLFTNKQCDKMKVLYWDKTGFALWAKGWKKTNFSGHIERKIRCYPEPNGIRTSVIRHHYSRP
ncbi:IS66 family insertion sequence element accessory protein TnpB [Photobacterium minamisatsumaniensis]|uniref:IS66 family insertion sequence element accessory protein TnpB n=1 Tax=Photobacterium minamisatsumaniensis TaxID=2910233 RepID=UPI003D0F11E0